MLPENVHEAAMKIGVFYLQKNNGDYKKTEEEISKLQISKIEVDDTLPNSVVISITTARPGMLIGRRGQNIDELTQYMGTKIKILEEKDPLSSWLIPSPEPTDEELAGGWRIESELARDFDYEYPPMYPEDDIRDF